VPLIQFTKSVILQHLSDAIATHSCIFRTKNETSKATQNNNESYTLFKAGPTSK